MAFGEVWEGSLSGRLEGPEEDNSGHGLHYGQGFAWELLDSRLLSPPCGVQGKPCCPLEKKVWMVSVSSQGGACQLVPEAEAPSFTGSQQTNEIRFSRTACPLLLDSGASERDLSARLRSHMGLGTFTHIIA